MTIIELTWRIVVGGGGVALVLLCLGGVGTVVADDTESKGLALFASFALFVVGSLLLSTALVGG